MQAFWNNVAWIANILEYISHLPVDIYIVVMSVLMNTSYSLYDPFFYNIAFNLSFMAMIYSGMVSIVGVLNSWLIGFALLGDPYLSGTGQV